MTENPVKVTKPRGKKPALPKEANVVPVSQKSLGFKMSREEEDKIKGWYEIAGSYTRTAAVASKNGINVSPTTVSRLIRRDQPEEKKE